MYGTLTLADLLNTTTQSIAQGGPGYERAVWQAFARSLAGYEKQLTEATSLWVERTTERLLGYGGISSMTMEDLDELGTPNTQKVTAGESMGFPMRRAGIAEQWTELFLSESTVADVAAQFVAVMEADTRRVLRDIKRAIFVSGNTSFVDRLTKDKPTLAVKALANADGMSVPTGPNGETFTAASHTHYAGTGSFVVGDITTLISNVAEHFEDNEIVVYINQAQEAAVRAFTGFQAFVDARIVQSQTTSYARGGYELFDYNNRDIGILGGAVVSIRPWVPASYVVALNRRVGPPLRMRERRAGSGDLRNIFEYQDHPLHSKGWMREFGIGVLGRWSAAVLYTANGTYADPTIS